VASGAGLSAVFYSWCFIAVDRNLGAPTAWRISVTVVAVLPALVITGCCHTSTGSPTGRANHG
jgi:hypothetical protein